MRMTSNEYCQDERLRECVVRNGVAKDWANVKRLIVEGLLPGDVVDDGGELRSFESRHLRSTEDPCWVAEACGVVVGAIALTQVIQDTAQIRWIRVAEPWQAGHIVARALVRAAAEHARAKRAS